MTVEPSAGIINPQDIQDVEFTLDATGFISDFYEGSLIFQHNAAGDPVIVPVNLTVNPLSKFEYAKFIMEYRTIKFGNIFCTI